MGVQSSYLWMSGGRGKKKLWSQQKLWKQFKVPPLFWGVLAHFSVVSGSASLEEIKNAEKARGQIKS